MESLYLLLAFVLSFAVAFAATPLVKVFAVKIGAVDKPSERRIHKKPTPRLGGLAIFYGFVISILCFCDINADVQGMIFGSLVIVVLGIVDDAKQLTAKVKLPFQILAALILCIFGARIDVLTVPQFISPEGVINLGWWSYPLTVLWVVGVTNAVNLIDGMDGLAAGVSSIASMSLFCISLILGDPVVAVITAALAGACFGFLPYNFNPAKIFMGDTGATFLGFILASVSVIGLFKSYAVISFAVPFLVLGLPIFDTGFTIIRRIISRRPIMQPDREHLHHRLLDMGFSQKQSVAILYLISTVLGICAIVLISSGAIRALVLIAMIIIFLVFASRFMGIREHEKTTEELNTETHGEEKVDNNEEH